MMEFRFHQHRYTQIFLAVYQWHVLKNISSENLFEENLSSSFIETSFLETKEKNMKTIDI